MQRSESVWNANITFFKEIVNIFVDIVFVFAAVQSQFTINIVQRSMWFEEDFRQLGWITTFVWQLEC